MPTATPFISLGAGNGFTYCVHKFNVRDFNNWTTLSGWSKVSEPADDAAKAASIAVSHELAMQIVWNLNSVKSNWDGFANDLEINGDQSKWGSIWWYKKVGTGIVMDVFFAPKDRVCYKYFSANDEDEYESGKFVYLNVSSWIYKLYNGPTDDEDNFVGYGLRLALSDIQQEGSNGVFRSGFRLRSFTDDVEYSFDTSEYISLNGIHLVAQYYDPSGGSMEADDVTITTEGDKVTCVAELSPSLTETFTTEIGFYTYT
jgi:hypothetical protein